MAAKNLLVRADEFKLLAYLHRIEERLLAGTDTLAEIADSAQKELGFTVTETNVRSIARDGGIEISPRPYRRIDNLFSRINGRVGDLEARITDLEKGVTKMMLTVSELCQQLGYRSKHEVNGR
jgi:hypothetical protein